MENFINDLSENEKIVLAYIEWDMGKYYSDLEETLKIKKSELKKITKKLKEYQLIQVSALVDIEGDRGGYFGKGFTTTEKGEKVKNYLDEKYFNFD